MDFMDINQMFPIFLEESQDCLNELSTNLLELEKDRTDEEAIKNIFRSAHTLKGSSYTFYSTFSDEVKPDNRLLLTNKLGDVTHALENLIMEARDNGMPITEYHIDLLFETERTLETILAIIESDSQEDIDVSSLQKRLLESVSNNTVNEPALDEPKIINSDLSLTFKLDTALETDFRFASLSLIYQEIEDKYENAIFNPTKKELENTIDFNDVFVTLHSTEPVEHVIEFLESVRFVEKAQLLDNTNSEENTSTDSQSDKQSEKEEEKNPTENLQSTSSPKDEHESTSTHSRSMTNQSLRVDIKRIDEVLKHVSSLVILRNKLANIAKKYNDKNLLDVTDEISQSIDFAQESVMSIRMTPLDQVFSRYPKDVRNIAKEFGKSVNFECEGGETEIDKSLLDELPKILTHLIKNSIFHGIESEEDRIAAGKNPKGLLRLSAKHEQSNVVITVEDDGKGMDVEKIKLKAIERGLVSKEKADKMSKSEIVDFSFHPGLSTADTVNNVAGRGVGMDAVRALVEQMKGHIDIQTEKGLGTKVIIHLPLTLAIIRAMLTKIEDNYFSIPISQVIEAVEVHTSELKYVANKEMYFLRKKEIPIIRLKEFFNLSHVRSEDEKLKVVVLKSGNKTIGVTVDEFVELEDIVIKNLGEFLGNIKGIAGCNIQGDGSISLIVDVNTITNSA